MMLNPSTTNPNSTISNKVTSTSVNDLKWKIYCDMDGVLVDFNKRFGELSAWGPEKFIEKNGLDEFWQTIDERGVGFWVGMDWMEDGKELFEYLTNNFEVELLSSPSRSEHSRLGKRLWVRNNKLGVKLNLVYSHNKQKYAAPNHVLIDDRKDIIKEWESQGGVGILHTSTKNTLECLKKKDIL